MLLVGIISIDLADELVLNRANRKSENCCHVQIFLMYMVLTTVIFQVSRARIIITVTGIQILSRTRPFRVSLILENPKGTIRIRVTQISFRQD
jgi:hypothetical protein